MESRKTLTTDSGAAVTDNQNSRTAGPAGPVLLEDHPLIEKLAHFDRERVPERVVHAKGSGAFGYFEVTDTVRDPRGWAMKFYTEEGNYDLVGNNTPVFFIRDPSKFSDFIHSQKRMGADG